jgi:hypothetical protein
VVFELEGEKIAVSKLQIFVIHLGALFVLNGCP